MHSIRNRLVFAILLGVLLLSALAGAGLIMVLRERLISEFDRSLEAKARALAALTTIEGRRIEFDFEDEIMPEFGAGGEDAEDEDGESEEEELDDDDEEDDDDDDDDEDDDEEMEHGPEYFALYYSEGQLISKSSSLQSAGDLAVDVLSAPDRLARKLELPDGRMGRLIQLRLKPREEKLDPDEQLETDGTEAIFDLPAGADEKTATVVLAVAQGTGRLNQLLAGVTWTVCLAVLVLLAGIGVLVTLVVRRGFRPVRELHEQVTTIGPESLTRRISLSERTEELHGIVESLNALISRLEEGFLRERRFTNDVAHELRTPVAELLAACDVGAKWPDDPHACQRLFEDIGGASRQMESIVESLLELARCESGTSTVETSVVPLRELVEECWRRTNGKAEERGITLANEIRSELCVESDRAKLRIIVQNLLDNAAAHGTKGRAVSCSTTGSEEGVELVFRNETEGLNREDSQFLFDRLWQSDASRGSKEHFGLGLSIVKALSALLGHPVQAGLVEESIFEMRLHFKPAS